MPKFIVKVREVWVQDVEIEADSEEEAKDKVESGEGEPVLGHNHFEFSHSLETDHWSVERKD